MERLCISSLVVQAQPAQFATVRNALESLPEAEVMGDDERCKLVVVLDTRDTRRAAETITRIRNFAGVLSANLIYQFDDHNKAQMEDSQ